jgi:predicted PurR-regulated permease PerM
MERIPSSFILPSSAITQNKTLPASIFGFGNQFLQSLIKSYNSTFGYMPKKVQKLKKVMTFLEKVEDFIRTHVGNVYATYFVILSTVIILIVMVVLFLIWRSKQNKSKYTKCEENRFSESLLNEFLEIDSRIEAEQVVPSAPPRESMNF